jgi:flagellar hook-basal body complex protein FliE
MDIKDVARFPELAGLAAPGAAPKGPAAPGGGRSFATVLADSLAQVNELQANADHAITQLATGQPVSLHDTMIAMEQADVSFRMMMQVRNKIIEAYQEIMRIQV